MTFANVQGAKICFVTRQPTLPRVHLVPLCIYPQRTGEVVYTDTMSDSTAVTPSHFEV